MRIGEILRKVFLWDLIQGLFVTFRYQDPKEIYTEQYPLERPQVAERYRGAPRLNVNPDTDESLCISCDLCALACPENLIVVTSERNEKTRRKELVNFTYDLSRCMFCGTESSYDLGADSLACPAESLGNRDCPRRIRVRDKTSSGSPLSRLAPRPSLHVLTDMTRC